MKMDAVTILTFMMVFSRCSAMMLTAPLFGAAVPVNIRVMASAAIALCLTPVVLPVAGPMPDSLVGLMLLFLREVMSGLLIGGCLQILVSAAEMAGSFVDVQIGLGSAQLFVPAMGTAATPIARFKVMLAITVLLSVDAHHVMLSGFLSSYSAHHLDLSSFRSAMDSLLFFLSQMMFLAIQIAAPAAAVSFIVDLGAALVNKAVPQTQPFLLALPAKLALGLVTLSVGLPAMALSMKNGVALAFEHMGRIFGAA